MGWSRTFQKSHEAGTVQVTSVSEGCVSAFPLRLISLYFIVLLVALLYPPESFSSFCLEQSIVQIRLWPFVVSTITFLSRAALPIIKWFYLNFEFEDVFVFDLNILYSNTYFAFY